MVEPSYPYRTKVLFNCAERTPLSFETRASVGGKVNQAVEYAIRLFNCAQPIGLTLQAIRKPGEGSFFM